MNRKEYTMTEKEITKALRWFAKVTTHCEHTIVSCPECEFHGFCTDPYSDDGICKMHECLTAAASLIESLQSDAASYQQIKKTLSDEGFSDLTTMISRYKHVMADANEIDIAKDEEMEQLRADLAVSQRRADAAVDDMQRVGRHLGACCACKYTRDSQECKERVEAMPDDIPYSGEPCTCWEWRSLHEAGEESG